MTENTLPAARRRGAGLIANVAVAICLASVIGCGDDRITTYTTTGSVVFEDGTPLPGGSVIFKSQDHPLSAQSMIGEDGTFELGTFETGDGAVAGKHSVAISPPKAQVDTDEGVFIPAIDVKYQDPRRSQIVYEVTADGENEFKITVTPPKGRR